MKELVATGRGCMEGLLGKGDVRPPWCTTDIATHRDNRAIALEGLAKDLPLCGEVEARDGDLGAR
eukprot:10450804-Alexandrium_andersonii.AAC.1